jgi:hypothetical protein
MSAGVSDRPPAAAGAARGADAGRWTVELPDRVGGGVVSAVQPPGRLGGEPLAWPAPPARYGEDRTEWTRG